MSSKRVLRSSTLWKVRIDTLAGEVRVRSTDDKGKAKDVSEKIDSGGPRQWHGFNFVKEHRTNAEKTSFSLLSRGPKPRIVKLVITSQGEESFSVAGSGRKATHYVIKIEIGGIAGVIAPISGKEPPDRHMWIYGREVRTMVKFEGPLCEDGPSGQIVPIRTGMATTRIARQTTLTNRN